MKWFLILFTPIAFITLLVLSIWTSSKPWKEAKEKLNEKYPLNTAIQVAGGLSSHWTLETKVKSRSATYILFPQVFSSFKAVTFYEEKNNEKLKQEITESTGVLLWIIFFNLALIFFTIFWSYPNIKALFVTTTLEQDDGHQQI